MGNVNVNGGALEFDAVINMQQFQTQLNRMELSLQGITKTAKDQSSEIQGFAQNAALAIGTYLSVAGIQNFVGDLVRVRGEFQQLEVAFTTMLGSKEKADKLMEQVKEFAATTPFELQDVAGATKQLLAFGISSDSVVATLRKLGDVSAGIGAPLGDIAYLFGTIKTQGVALTQDVRQFASRGIPIYEELSKVLKVNVEQVGDFITAGKVGFPEIEAAFTSMTAEGSKFGGLMDAQSKTLTGQLSNLSDAWAQMLNDIGKSGEGVFADTISAATNLVKHYQDVLDILKVLAITYGTYKAAVVVSTAVNIIQADAVNGVTIAESLRARATLISEKAMALLNKAMLLNPWVAAVTVIAAVTAGFLIFGKTATEVKSKAELLADAQENVGDKMAETETKIRPYVEALKRANVSEQEKLDIYNKLKVIDPDIVKGIDAKTISYENLTKNVDAYLGALRKQFALEANKEALQGSFKTEASIQKQIDLLKKRKKEQDDQAKSARDSETKGLAQFESQRLETQTKVLQQQLEDQKKITEELGQVQFDAEKKADGLLVRTLKNIDEDIAAQKKAQSEFSSNSKQYLDYQNKINALEDERRKITGATKREIAESNKLESKSNSLLEERKNLLEAIAGLQKDARLSGLTKEQSELEKINAKYDNMIDKLVEFNKKTDEFNRKNNTNVQKFGLVDLATVNDTRNKEIGNTALIKQGSEIFKNDLEAQKKIFEDFQQSVKDIGIEKAQEIFGEQTKGFTTFLSFLEAEAKKNINLINPAKMQEIVSQINSEQKKSEEDLFKERVENFKRLLVSTASFNQQRIVYERQYEKDVASLKKEFTGQDLEERLKVLKEAKDQDLKNLAESIAQQTKGYRALNQNLVNFTRERIKLEIEALQKLLQNSSLDKATRDAIKSAINQWKDLDNSISDSSVTIDDFIEKGSKIGGLFSDLSSAVEPFNKKLSEALNTMSQMIGSTLQIAKGFKDFKIAKDNGDSLGQVSAVTDIFTAVLKGIQLIVDGVKKTKAAMKEVQQQTSDFYIQLITGEQTYQELLRERQRQTVLNNKTTLEGIEAQNKLLLQQKQINAAAAADLLKQLQSETFLAGVEGKKKSLFKRNLLELFSSKPTEIKQITESLAGKSFDQLEELFNKGQLIGKAKDLFEQLQKIKAEGADIDALLEENKKRVQEIFTGTTSDSIVDTIADGFRNGLHSAADFAGTFEDLMREAMISSLKFQYLEPALKQFFEQFAAASQSDNTLTQSEIDNLKNLFNSSIADFDQKLQQFQQISGINLQSSTADSNSLKGAIKSVTEQTAELLAGQMGGLRLTAIDQLNLMKQALVVHQNIENNTALTAARVDNLFNLFDQVTKGTLKLNIK